MFDSLEHSPQGATESLPQVLAAVKFDANGLIPAIAQNHSTGEVLMLAWMNAEAIASTLEDGFACYYSRSRQSLWRKGETSGHTQKLVNMRFDCDGDAILLAVEQTGPACHTNRSSCFYIQVDDQNVRVISPVVSGVDS